MEKPRTNRLRDELRSTNCRLERPTAVIMPNNVQNSAPRTGSGNDAKRALNFPTIPSSSISAAPYWITRLLPTYTIKHREWRKPPIYFHLMLMLWFSSCRPTKFYTLGFGFESNKCQWIMQWLKDLNKIRSQRLFSEQFDISDL